MGFQDRLEKKSYCFRFVKQEDRLEKLRKEEEVVFFSWICFRRINKEERKHRFVIKDRSTGDYIGPYIFGLHTLGQNIV